MLANSAKNLIRSSFLYSKMPMSLSRSNFMLRAINKNEQKLDNDGQNDKKNDENCQAPLQESHLEENKKLLETIKDIDDKYKRALAEAENTRVRMRKQLDDMKIYAIQNFCKDLLEVTDVFKSAIEAVPKNSIDNNDFKNLYDGVVMTEQQMHNVFRRHGLVPINPIGLKFNPNEHHALFEVQAPDKEPGTVFEVTKIGYKLHDRTIRPAMVGVVKNK